MSKEFDVWYADGRSNTPSVGRHSLGTKCKDEAVKLVHQLDAQMAVQHGLADPAILEQDDGNVLTISEGAKLYLKHVGRAAIAGGASKKTIQRYEAVFSKFAEYASGEGVECWEWVARRLLEGYASWLDDHDYAYRTEYLELTTIKQAMKWLAGEGLIPSRSLFAMPLKKPVGSPTYAYTMDEVRAIVRHCIADEQLKWLGRVVLTLSLSGMRVSEVAQLQWEDIDLDERVVHVRDGSRGATRLDGDKERTTKGRRSRVVPMHRELHQMFISMASAQKGRVFFGPRGGRLKPDTVRNVLTRAVLPTVAKQLYPDDSAPQMLEGRVHSFRHTFCTQAYRAGWPERTILDVMGHQSSEITRLYRHLSPDEYKTAMDSFASIGGFADDDEQ